MRRLDVGIIDNCGEVLLALCGLCGGLDRANNSKVVSQ